MYSVEARRGKKWKRDEEDELQKMDEPALAGSYICVCGNLVSKGVHLMLTTHVQTAEACFTERTAGAAGMCFGLVQRRSSHTSGYGRRTP